MASLTLPAPATASAAPSSSKSKSETKTFNDITSTYAARFGKNDDQTTATDEQRQVRQKTAAEGTDQYVPVSTRRQIVPILPNH